MAEQIKMSWQEMERAAKTCDTQSQKIQELIRSMNSMVSNLGTVTKGEAYNALNERWNSDLRKAFQDSDQLMQDIAKALRKTSDNYRRMDEEAGQSLRNRG